MNNQENTVSGVNAENNQLRHALRMAAGFIESGESAGHTFFEVREAWRNALDGTTPGNQTALAEAAHDMRAALELFVENMAPRYPDDHLCMKKARAAIEKARAAQ